MKYSTHSSQFLDADPAPMILPDDGNRRVMKLAITALIQFHAIIFLAWFTWKLSISFAP